MLFGFFLDLPDIIDFLNVDLLDQRYTHLHLFVSKTFWRRLQDMSSRRLQDMFSRLLQEMSSTLLQDKSSRQLQDVFSVTIFRLPRRLEHVYRDVLKKFRRSIQDNFARRLGRRNTVTLNKWWRRPQYMSWRRLEDVLKTSRCLLGL